MNVAVNIWKNIVSDENVDMGFVFDYLDFIENLWGHEINNRIEEWYDV